MKTKLFILALTIALTMYSCEKSNSDFGGFPTNFSLALVDAQTHKGLIDTTESAYYHVDSLKLISQSGEIVDPIFFDDGGDLNYSPYDGGILYFIVVIHQTDWQEEDFERLYGQQMDTIFFLRLNEHETDTIDVSLKNDGRGFQINYRNHNTYTQEHGFINYYVEKNINNAKK